MNDIKFRMAMKENSQMEETQVVSLDLANHVLSAGSFLF